jgi:cell division protein ZapE
MVQAGNVLKLAKINATVNIEEVVKGFVPTPRFAHVSFDNYRPDPHIESQNAAVARLRAYISEINAQTQQKNGVLWRWFSRKPVENTAKGLYVDGGYGVGKTHLLAASFQTAPAPKAYLSFQELAYVIGVMGMQQCVQAFSNHRLICIDEFELDDVGNTMLAKTFLTNITQGFTRIITTSNTLPSDLGKGRFAADDFKREIGIIAAVFETIRIEGEDYRHRTYSKTDLSQGVHSADDGIVENQFEHYQPVQNAKVFATFDELSTQLANHHPIAYTKLLQPIEALFISGIYPIEEQTVALRFVHFIDKLYDLRIKLSLSSHCSLLDIFPAEYRDKGYAKKYRRCLSRLHELLAEWNEQ